MADGRGKGTARRALLRDHPLYPLASTVANINLDYFSNWGWGRTKDFSIVGLGNSTLDDLTAEAVQRQGRVLTGDTAPEMGFYFRSDHYEFAKAGVPIPRDQSGHRLCRKTGWLRRTDARELHRKRLSQRIGRDEA